MFRYFAVRVSGLMGSPNAFIIAVLLVVAWAGSGETFGYSDTWQLAINTTTTIVTFLMVFLIQNTQNRDAKATHLKLDELIRAVKGARTGLVDIENLSDEELEQLQKEFGELRTKRTTRFLKLLHEHIAEERARRGGFRQFFGESAPAAPAPKSKPAQRSRTRKQTR